MKSKVSTGTPAGGAARFGADQVEVRYREWLEEKARGGMAFTVEQRRWLDAIKDHIASSLAIEPDDFEDVPFNRWGGLGVCTGRSARIWTRCWRREGAARRRIDFDLNDAPPSHGPGEALGRGRGHGLVARVERRPAPEAESADRVAWPGMMPPEHRAR